MSRFFCIVSHENLPRLPTPFAPVLMSYRVGPGPELLRSQGPVPLRGGLLGLNAVSTIPEGDPGHFCRQVVRECQARGAAGVLADWEPMQRSLLPLVRRLGQALRPAGLLLLLPECWGGAVEGACILIHSPLSGGTLELRLKEAAERYGAERTVLALQPMGEDFLLPAPSGQGKTLSRQALADLRSRTHAPAYWSRELCARYFTYRDGQGVHFVLFDDGDSLCRKLELAGGLGIRCAVAAWEEIAPWSSVLSGSPFLSGRE
ncbi:MAG: hypothetical protein LUG47_05845 [Clostridiales bacterium]|nr:hypothetical protein [Clostridiales bacterium]